MILENLKIKNFRNYENLSIQFNQGIHFIIGKNGQGKTNLLESIYYLSCTKSHRTGNNFDLIKKSHSFFMLEADIRKNNKKIDLKCIVNEKGKNLYSFKNPMKRVSDYIGILNAVMFCPNDMNLFDSVPKERRKFIDLELGKLSKSYTSTLNHYYKLLKERNSYLKNDKVEENFISVLDEQMIDCQITIIQQRQKFIDDIIKNSKNFYDRLSEDKTEIHCLYQSFVLFENSDDMKKKMKEKYMKYRERDILYRQTHAGIHKDDFVFMINEHEIASYASQGQKRSILLALKLGIVETIYILTKTYPILLLDDVFSELDIDRREMLLKLLNDDIQIFISSTDKIEINEEKNIYYWIVEKGSIQQLKED